MTSIPSSRRRIGADSFGRGGEMAEKVLAFDWAGTSLGPIEAWPSALLNVLRMVLASRQPICFWWGPDLRQFHNDDYLPMLADRRDRALGARFQELWADVWDDVKPFVDTALSGRGTWTENLPLDMIRNGRVERTYWTFSYSPLYDDDGNIAGLMNIVTETTAAIRDREALAAEIERTQAALLAQKEAERQQRLLQRELTHRMKNTLAMVQAVVSQSLRHSTDLERGARMAIDRIGALARAQDILTSTTEEAADIQEVVQAAINPHSDQGERFLIEGLSFKLTAQQALGLSLAVHELATNAAKHGALSNTFGKVRIAWMIADDRRFAFEWTEAGGPAVEVPDRKGFGSRLTMSIVPTYFDGQAEIAYRREGIVYTLSGRLADHAAEAAATTGGEA